MCIGVPTCFRPTSIRFGGETILVDRYPHFSARIVVGPIRGAKSSGCAAGVHTGVQNLNMPSRLRFALAQLGAKPGGAESLSSLVGPDDLPGTGWKVTDKRTWRTGTQGSDDMWAQRAVEANSVTAWRSFRQSDRWLWAQLVPLANPEDAELALQAAPARMLANLRARVRVESESDVDGIAVPGAGATWAYEQHTTDHPLAGVTRMLAWTVGDRLFVLAGSGVPEWTWDDLLVVASRQSERAKA